MSLARLALLLAVFTPLVVFPGFGEYSQNPPKVAVLFAAAVLGGLAVVIESRRRGEWRTRRDPVATAAGLVIASSLLSLVKAVNPWEGVVPLVQLGAGLLIYRTATSGEATRIFLARTLVAAMAAVGVAVAAITAAQAGWWPERMRGATLGNPNWTAEVLAPLLPLALAPALGGSLPATIAGWGAAAAVIGAGLAATGSRAGLTAGAAGVAVVVLLRLAPWGKRIGLPPARPAVAALLMAAVAGAGWLGLRASGYDPAERIRSLTDPGHPSFTSGRQRLGIARASLGLWRAEPALGVGPGNFRLRFPPHRDPAEARLGNPDAEVEAPHSDLLLALTEGGVVGAVLLILFGIVIAVRCAVYLPQAESPFDYARLSGIAGFLAAFAVEGLFSHPLAHPGSAALLWPALGILEHVGQDRAKFRKGDFHEARLAVVLAAGIATGFLGWHLAERTAGEWEYSRALDAWRASARLRRDGDPGGADESFRLALAGADASTDWFHPNWRAHQLRARLLLGAGNVDDALPAARASLEFHPDNVQTLILLGHILRARAAEGRSALSEAIAAYRRAAALHPGHAAARFNLGLACGAAGRPEEAERAFREALAIDPAHGPAAYNLAAVLAGSGRLAEALPLLRRAAAAGVDVAASLRGDPAFRPCLGDPSLREFLR